MEVTAHWEGGFTTRVPIGRFEIWIDEPGEHGGRGLGPAPTQMLLASIASCFAMAVYHAARKREVTLPDLAVRVHGDYEGLRFSRIRVEVVSSHPDRAELDDLREQAIDYCYVTNTIRSDPEVSFALAEPAGGGSPTSHEPPLPTG
jgi:putative redox protein